MVERFFFGPYAEAESDFYPKLPTKKGIGFSREHAALIGQSVYETSKILDTEPVASDVEGWEKNFSQDLADAFSDHMQQTCENRNECKIALAKACDWWRYSLLSTPYVMDDGTLIDFNDLKVQRSGDFLTTSSNGVGRGVCAAAIGSASVEMGDDCLEWPVVDHEQLTRDYKDIGLPVRDVEVQKRDDFVFCSHRFTRQNDGSWKCWLETWHRMMYEASFNEINDLSTTANYLQEIEDMPAGPEKDLIALFIQCREELLGAVAEHDEDKESEKDQHPGLKSGCAGGFEPPDCE